MPAAKRTNKRAAAAAALAESDDDENTRKTTPMSNKTKGKQPVRVAAPRNTPMASPAKGNSSSADAALPATPSTTKRAKISKKAHKISMADLAESAGFANLSSGGPKDDASKPDNVKKQKKIEMTVKLAQHMSGPKKGSVSAPRFEAAAPT